VTTIGRKLQVKMMNLKTIYLMSYLNPEPRTLTPAFRLTAKATAAVTATAETAAVVTAARTPGLRAVIIALALVTA